MKDAYDLLFTKYNKEQFFMDGLESIIYIDEIKIEEHWKEIVNKLMNNEELFIRGYGRNADVNTEAFQVLYKYLFNNSKIKKDANNNDAPTKLLAKLTDYSKVPKQDKQLIQNYQVSHLFGRTKNPLLFTAGWNVAYIPKYLDPFTGHETKGSHSLEFKTIFMKKNILLFGKFINEYNQFVSENITPNLEESLRLTLRDLAHSEIDLSQFEHDARNELALIN